MKFELALTYETEIAEGDADSPFAAWRLGESLARWLSRTELAPELGSYQGKAEVFSLSWRDDQGRNHYTTFPPREPAAVPKQPLPMAAGDEEGAGDGTGE